MPRLHFFVLLSFSVVLSALPARAQNQAEEPAYCDETTTVSFDIGPDDLSFYGDEMKEIIEPGRFDLMVGHSATNIAATTTLQVVEK